MNEPSVFDEKDQTMPLFNKHTMADGKEVDHCDVHQLYGLLMQKATWKGMLKRDQE